MLEHKNAYLRFINLALAAEKLSYFPSLEPTEMRVLKLLSVYWLKKQLITVVEAMNMTSEISTSTIFRNLKKLREKGYVELVVDDVDNRVKYISPTKQADKYFSNLGKLMFKAID